MGWYDTNWNYRMSATIPNVGGTDTPECQFTIPKQAGKFWDNVLDNFNDVRITQADGITPLSFAFHGGTPSKDNKECTIQIDNHPGLANLYGTANALIGIHIYFGNDTTNLASGVDNSINVTTNGAKVPIIDLVSPGSAATNHLFKCYKPAPDDLYPVYRIRKQVSDSVKIFWDLSSCVEVLNRASESSLKYEEIAYVQTIIYDQDGADTTSAMTDTSKITIGDNYVVQMPIKAGTHEKRYIIIMTFGLVNPAGNMRVLDQRATLLVNNLGLHTS